MAERSDNALINGSRSISRLESTPPSDEKDSINSCNEEVLETVWLENKFKILETLRRRSDSKI